MNEKLRQFLDLIDEMLCDPEVGGELVDVLAAIRGPDVDEYGNIKGQTTTFIRKAAFPKVCAETRISCIGNTRWNLHQSKDTLARGLLFERSFLYDHFQSHIRSAAKALGLPFTEP